MKQTLLPVMAWLCHNSGFNFLCRPVYGGLGLILMFHRFTNEPEKRIDQNGVISAGFFDQLLTYIHKSGLDIIPLSDVPRAIKESRQFICLTSDDGYRDNWEIAVPILRRHQAPATFFIPTNLLDGTLDAWWLQVEEMVRAEEKPALAYARIMARASDNPEALEQLRPAFKADQQELNERYFIGASQVQALDGDPLFTIGGHTLTHPLLRHLPEKEAFREIKQNKDDLEDLLDRPVEIFAYPFGHEEACGEREYKLAERAGYKIAVTTREGNIMPAHKDHLLALPRYSVRGRHEYLPMFTLQRYGTYRALKSRFGPPVVTG